MRTTLLLPALSLAVIAAIAAHPHAATAQVQQVYTSRGEVAAPDTTAAPYVSGSTLLRRADALVSMAQTAPSGASTYPNAREAAHAARAAQDAYDAAVSNYSNGYYATADSAARVAIQKAELAAAVAARPPAPPLQMVSEGEVGAPGPTTILVPNPAPAVLIREASDYVTSSYAGLTPQPFGTYPANGPYPPAMRDSLPFGTTAVGRTPTVVAP